MKEEEKELFEETLKYTIGLCLIAFIIIEPFSLALSDDKVAYKINMDLMTQSIDTEYFEKFLGLNDIISRIMSSEFYKDFISGFEDNEEMSMATYSVVREDYWDIESLGEIEKQIELLSSSEKLMFNILKAGIGVTNFYLYGGFCWYFTSIKSNFERHSFGGEEFQNYLKAQNKYNQPCSNVYISVMNVHKEVLYFEHNELLADEEIATLKLLECNEANSSCS